MGIIVVGAGPAGAATAWLLARAGVEVTVLERAVDFARVFRGEGLMPFGVRALRQMGLGDLLDSIPSRPIEAWEVWIGGRAGLTVAEPEAPDGAGARVVSQPALLEGIVERARALPTFRLVTGARVRDLVRDGDRVVGVRYQDEAGVHALEGDLVIGADGRGSVVRARAGLDLEHLPEAYDVLWFKVPAPDRLRDRCVFTILIEGGAHPAVCYTSWDGRLQYGLIMPKGGHRAIRDADWLEEAARPAPGWLADHLRAVRDEAEGPTRLNVMVGRAPRWTAPGVLLIGDAAHPMSPVRAQGINLALRDAIVTANHLVPAGADRAALDAAAAAVQAERAPEIVRSQTLQHREARGQVDAREATWRFHLGRRLLPFFGRFEWVKRAWLAQQRVLRDGGTPVELRV